MPTYDAFDYRYLTGVVNRMRSSNTVLQEVLFPIHENSYAEDIEISYLDSGRTMAPFVKVNGAAIMVPGHSESYTTVKPTNIRISRPFSPSTLLWTRRPGTSIFADARTQAREMNLHIARDLQVVNDKVTNSWEWLCSQALTGQIQYSVEGGDVFRLNFNRSSTHDITLDNTVDWDNANLDLPRPLEVTWLVKSLLSEEGLTPTDAIAGANAAAALRELAQADKLKALKTDSGIAAGSITFISQFNRDGLVFLGELGGIRFWHYNRSVVDASGASIKMIRDDYVEFFDANNQASNRVMYFGAIPDWKAISSGTYIGERFSKSWESDDPSTRMYLIHSRPLPVPRLPNATVSVKVTNV